MANYSVQNSSNIAAQQSLTTTYKTVLATAATTGVTGPGFQVRRGKLYDLAIGTNGVAVIDFGRRRPNPFAIPRALLISSVRARIIASRARMRANPSCCSAVRCSPAPANARPWLCWRGLAVIHFSSRALPTITS